jgi:hypothetical protein
MILLQKKKTQKMIKVTMVVEDKHTNIAEGKNIEVDKKYI